MTQKNFRKIQTRGTVYEKKSADERAPHKSTPLRAAPYFRPDPLHGSPSRSSLTNRFNLFFTHTARFRQTVKQIYLANKSYLATRGDLKTDLSQYFATVSAAHSDTDDVYEAENKWECPGLLTM